MKKMKKTPFYNLIKLFAIFTFLVFNSTACSDQCKDTFCENGYCIKGDCFCSDGYSGDNCEIKESDKFGGEYKGVLTYNEIPQSGTEMLIKTKPSNPWDVSVSLSNNNGIDYQLNAHVNKDTLFIEKQFVEENDFYNLIYPSTAILEKDSILNFDLNIKPKDYDKITLKIEMIKEK